MEQTELVSKILERLDQITRKSGVVPADQQEQQVFVRLDQVEKIVSSIERYLPRRIIDKILLNPEGSQVEGERRPVTILFGDLSGFTSMSETMDPEQVVEVVNDYFDRMVEIASRYGGHIDKFMGDALMVLFGAPVVHEDDPLRACLAAIEMLEAMDRFSRERKMNLAMSIGLNSGEVVALNVGSRERMEYTVIGDNVNLAARLEKVANARECVIGENTYRQVKGKIRLKKLKPVMVKGKSKPQNVYLILGRVEAEEKAGALRSGSIKMVGRQAEMDGIRQSVQMAKSGNGQIVAITGEPGLGKSRLAKELELLTRGENFKFIKGKCYSYASGMAYLPFLRQLNVLTGITESDPGPKKAENLQSCLQSLDLLDFEPYLGSLLGLPYPEAETLDPEKRKRKTFEAFSMLYSKTAAKQPLVLAFEDLHWADTITLELLEHLVNDLEKQPVLVCCDYRPELALPFIARPNCLSLVLKKLDIRETLQMVSGLTQVQDVSDEVLKKIGERTEGNPLFIEETIRNLLSRRLVKRDGPSLQASKRFEKISLPNTVAAMVLGRIDKLSEELRRTLQYAAVIGKEFDSRLLGRLSGQNPEQIQPLLDNLEHFEGLLYSKLLEGKRTYEFHSTTTHEAAYSTLLKGRRSELHGKAAQSIERDYQKDLYSHYEDLAHHYYYSKDRDKAVNCLHRAGDKARRLYANPEAVEFYRKGLEVVKLLKESRPNLLETAELLGAQGAIFRLTGRRDQALKNFITAAKIAQREKETRAEWKYLLEAGIIHDMLGQVDKARETLDSVLTQAESKGDELITARVLINNGQIFLRGGKTEEAITYFTKALSIYQILKNDKETAQVHGSLGKAFELTGEIPKAIEHYRSAIELSTAINYAEGIALQNNNIGNPLLILGETDAAHNHFTIALETAKKIGDRRTESLAGFNMGNIQFVLGNYLAAHDYYDQALKSAKEIGEIAQQMSIYSNIGSLQQIWGDATAAIEKHTTALKISQGIDDCNNEVEIRRNLGLDLALQGKYPDSLNELIRAAELAAKIGDPRMQAYIKANLGALYHNLGQLEQADKNINESLDEARKVRDPEIILAAARALVEFKLETGDIPGAEEHVNRLLGLAEKTQNKREMAYGLLNLSTLLRRKNEAGEMAQPLSESLILAQELKDKFLLGRIYLLFAQKALLSGNIREAGDYLKDASGMAQKTGSPELSWQTGYYLSRLYELKENKLQAKKELETSRKIIKQMENALPQDLRKGFIENTSRRLVFN
ncbi:tetratricopeptide repeat protein [candidate division TA06 bacterium]|uniref:Tetratricopeptide repeat protein n=1 Tax=candidate division TA06 bacterium TaxID=2250710 RepID=A0A933MKS7_UNCT6|nr:tetratricopeptide repeat protein [candidate division TA06 bacterium]